MGGDVEDLEDDSDVELEGVDLEGVDDVMDESIHEIKTAEMPTADQKVAAAAAGKEIDDDSALALAAEEAAELEAANKERQELVQANLMKQAQGEPPATADVQSRLDYLLNQSDVFAHFLAGSVASVNKKNAKSGKGRGKGRLTEEEEDAQLLKSAQSKRRVVRLDHQPSCLAPICQMHPYQLEGLNWLIKLHDHGINAILADGAFFLDELTIRYPNGQTHWAITHSLLLLLFD
jgi:SWI/SNF-related matrix-associated actin-dependent regulator of chromatin subfamily A member 5